MSGGRLSRAKAFSSEVDSVRVKKTRQIMNLEPRFDSIETEEALVRKSTLPPAAARRPR